MQNVEVEEKMFPVRGVFFIMYMGMFDCYPRHKWRLRLRIP